MLRKHFVLQGFIILAGTHLLLVLYFLPLCENQLQPVMPYKWVSLLARTLKSLENEDCILIWPSFP